MILNGEYVKKLLNKGLYVNCIGGEYNYTKRQWEFTKIKTSKICKENYLDLDDYLYIYS